MIGLLLLVWLSVYCGCLFSYYMGRQEEVSPNTLMLYDLARKYGWGEWHSRPAALFIMDEIKKGE